MEAELSVRNVELPLLKCCLERLLALYDCLSQVEEEPDGTLRLRLWTHHKTDDSLRRAQVSCIFRQVLAVRNDFLACSESCFGPRIHGLLWDRQRGQGNDEISIRLPGSFPMSSLTHGAFVRRKAYYIRFYYTPLEGRV